MLSKAAVLSAHPPPSGPEPVDCATSAPCSRTVTRLSNAYASRSPCGLVDSDGAVPRDHEPVLRTTRLLQRQGHGLRTAQRQVVIERRRPPRVGIAVDPHLRPGRKRCGERTDLAQRRQLQAVDGGIGRLEGHIGLDVIGQLHRVVELRPLRLDGGERLAGEIQLPARASRSCWLWLRLAVSAWFCDARA